MAALMKKYIHQLEDAVVVAAMERLHLDDLRGLLSKDERRVFLWLLPWLHRASRTPRGISRFLEYFLHLPVRVDGMSPRTYEMPDGDAAGCVGTGEGGKLGENLLLGGCIRDAGAVVEIAVGPLNPDQCKELVTRRWAVRNDDGGLAASSKAGALAGCLVPVWLEVRWRFERVHVAEERTGFTLGSSRLGLEMMDGEAA